MTALNALVLLDVFGMILITLSSINAGTSKTQGDLYYPPYDCNSYNIKSN